MLCKMKDLLEAAEKKNRAVGAFNVGNMEMVIGAVKAAEEKKTPIIIQIAEKRLYASPLNYMAPMMIQAAKDSKVKIAVNLDHGVSMECIKQALDFGFTSVMYDGSDYSIEENIRRTCEVKKLASNYGATVEAEFGIVGGNEGNGTQKIVCTDTKYAQYFCENTGIDALAVAVGNVHGHYKGKPNLKFDVLREIDNSTNIPLVLHGGTGISPDDFRHCIDCGIRKINIATANFDSVVKAGGNYFKEFQDEKKYNYFDFSRNIADSVCENIKKYIYIFNNGVV